MIKDINGHTIRVGNRVLIHATILALDHTNPGGPIAVNVGRGESATGSNFSVHAGHLELHPDEAPEKPENVPGKKADVPRGSDVQTIRQNPPGIVKDNSGQRVPAEGWIEDEERRRKEAAVKDPRTSPGDLVAKTRHEQAEERERKAKEDAQTNADNVDLTEREKRLNHTAEEAEDAAKRDKGPKTDGGTGATTEKGEGNSSKDAIKKDGVGQIAPQSVA